MATAPVIERSYESLVVCPSDTSPKLIDELTEKIKKAVTVSEGTVHSVQVWGRRRLTFPIKHHKEGMFLFVDFNGKNQVVKELDNLFHVTDLVLRHMTVHRVDRPEPRQVPASAAPVPSAESQPAPAQSKPESKQESPSTNKEA